MIWVDADACPKKARAAVEAAATRHRVETVLVCDGGLRPVEHPFVSVRYVTAGLDAADDLIAGAIGPGDLLLTNDIPLADRAIAMGAAVLRFDGEEIDARNIAQRLAARNAADAAREGIGHLAGDPGRGSGYTDRDRQRLADALDRVLRRLA